jgi:hypothetical protein
MKRMSGLLFDRVNNDSRVEAQLVEEKRVRVDHFDQEPLQHVGRKILSVRRYDGIGSSSHGSRYDVEVVRVWQHEIQANALPSFDARVLEGSFSSMQTAERSRQHRRRMRLKDGILRFKVVEKVLTACRAVVRY